MKKKNKFIVNCNYFVSILYSLLLMSIKLFFNVSKEFFDQMYSPGFDETENIIESTDEEKGFQEWFEKQNEELCMCNLCIIITQILSMLELKKIIKRE